MISSSQSCLEPSDLLAAPSDFIAVPNSHGPQQYTDCGSGILDWSTAYVAGLVTPWVFR